MSMRNLLETKGLTYVLQLVGGQDKYQVKVCAILILQLFFRAFFIMFYPFINQPPVFLCRDSEGNDYNCTETTGGCEEMRLSPDSPSSLVNDLGLYCDMSYVRTLASTLFFFGGNIGAGVYSYLSDAKGRKFAMFFAYFLGSLSLVLLGTVAVGAFSYILCLMLIWGNYSCFCTISITYVAEVTNEKYGKNASLVVLLGTVVAEIVVVALALFITNWRVLYLTCIVAPALLSCFAFKLLDETPAYLCGKRDYVKAEEVLRKIAQTNGKSIDAEILAAGENMSAKTREEAPVRSWNYFQIITHPKLRLRVLVFSIIKMYLCMAFYGCIFALSSLGGSIYTNSFIAAFAEGLGYIISLKAYLFPTKKLLKGSLQIVVATGISFLLIPTVSCSSFFLCTPLFLQGFLALIMRTAICFIYGFIYSLGNELFPTEVRCQSIGVSEIFSALGGMVAPFVIVAAEVNGVSPLFLFGTMGFLALSTSKYLPENQLTSMDDNPKEGTEMSYVRMSEKKSVM